MDIQILCISIFIGVIGAYVIGFTDNPIRRKLSEYYYPSQTQGDKGN